MKKLLTVLFAIILFAGYTNAQKDMSLGAGVIVSLPMGDFGDAANTGFGGTASFEMDLIPQLVGVGQAGYITWGTDVDEVSFSAIPILVGVKYFFVPGIGFYGIGQLGLTIFSADTPEIVTPIGTFGGSESSTEFTFGIGAGYEIPVAPNVALDFTGGFNLISDANNIQLRAGAKFGL